MTRAALAGALLLTAGLGAATHFHLQEAPAPADPLGEKTGGDTTVNANGRNAFSFPAANLPDAERTRFVIGNSFFKRNWVESPALTTARDGLGPHFLARSCAGCHMHDGRGKPPSWRKGLSDEEPLSLLMRLSVPGAGPHGGPNPEPSYGDQLNTSAIQNVTPEGKVVLRWEPVAGQFADGTPYTLQKPLYELRDLAYGPMAAEVMMSPRIAPQIVGLGLIEAIAEKDITANAQAQARIPGPIKGQPNYVWDAFAEREMLGRFGWKANVATIAHQTAGAFHGDIGRLSKLFAADSCMPMQKDCLASLKASASDQPDIEDKILDDVIFYQAALAPPARRDPGNAEVIRGQQLFAEAQCAVCHRPSY